HGAHDAATHRDGDDHRSTNAQSLVARAIDGIRNLSDGRKREQLAAEERFACPRKLLLESCARQDRRSGDTLATPDANGHESLVAVLDPEEGTAIAVERLADSLQRLPYRLDNPLVRQVQELEGKVGDEPLELQLLLEGRVCRLVELTPGGDVDNGEE